MASTKPVSQTMNAPMIQLGGVAKETVQELHCTIMDILAADCDESTKKLALKTLGKGIVSNVSETSMSNISCTIFGAKQNV